MAEVCSWVHSTAAAPEPEGRACWQGSFEASYVLRPHLPPAVLSPDQMLSPVAFEKLWFVREPWLSLRGPSPTFPEPLPAETRLRSHPRHPGVAALLASAAVTGGFSLC